MEKGFVSKMTFKQRSRGLSLAEAWDLGAVH